MSSSVNSRTCPLCVTQCDTQRIYTLYIYIYSARVHSIYNDISFAIYRVEGVFENETIRPFIPCSLFLDLSCALFFSCARSLSLSLSLCCSFSLALARTHTLECPHARTPAPPSTHTHNPLPCVRGVASVPSLVCHIERHSLCVSH